MSSLVSRVTKTLCQNQGSLDLSSLNEALLQKWTVGEAEMQRVLSDQKRFTIQEGKVNTLIVAKSSLRLCQNNLDQCLQCEALHLCRFWVLDGCTFGPKCKKGHSLVSPHNVELLRRHDLHELTEKQLFQLLLQNDSSLLPEVCLHYNKGNGLHGSCKHTSTCTKLHVCLHFLRNDCTYGSSCKRNHDFGPSEMKKFKGVSQKNLKNLLGIYRNKLIISAHQETRTSVAPPAVVHSRTAAVAASSSPALSEADKNEICLYFLRSKCFYKDRCALVHWHLPYRWQVLDSSRSQWTDLQCMEDIERSYCDPEKDSTVSSITDLLVLRQQLATVSVPSVDFLTMTSEGSPVRRQSTASSASKPSHYILTTEWLWYWKDEREKWVEFGQSGAESSASVSSSTLENVYLADKNAQIPFSAGRHQYVISLKSSGPMYQQNVKYGTSREVRRRPRLVSAQDIQEKSKSSSSASSETVPSNWDKNALPDVGYKMVPLSKSAKDYSSIETLFKRTLPSQTIVSLHRVQNPSLWKFFRWQREQMEKRNGGRAVNQQYLFHGTDSSLLEAICEQNFDWRMCGVHGTLFGKGSYFARDAVYSDRYSTVKIGSRNKMMFVALVLVGDYTTGKSAYVRPPYKPDGKTLYDSCVNQKLDPSIFVIFEKHQIYPEYVIEYL